MAIKAKWVDYYDPKQDITDIQTKLDTVGVKRKSISLNQDSSGTWSVANIGWTIDDYKIGDIINLSVTPYSTGLSPAAVNYTAIVVDKFGSLGTTLYLEGVCDIIDIRITNNKSVTVNDLRRIYSAPTAGNKVLTSVDTNGVISTQWADAASDAGATTYTVYIKSENLSITSATWGEFSDAKIGDFIWLRDQTTNIQYEATIIDKGTTSGKVTLTLAGLTGDIVNVRLFDDLTVQISKLQKINYPNPTEAGKVLLSVQDGDKVTPKWMDYSTEDMISYGLSYSSFKNPTNVAIGNPAMSTSLPVQSGMVTGVFKGNDLQYWLKPDNWTMIDGIEEEILKLTDTSTKTQPTPLYDKGFYDPYGVITLYDNVNNNDIEDESAFQKANESGAYNPQTGRCVLNIRQIQNNIINKIIESHANFSIYYHEYDLYVIKDENLINLEISAVERGSEDNLLITAYIDEFRDLASWGDIESLIFDWTYGVIVLLNPNLSGYDGEVMTYVPRFGMKSKPGEIRIFPDNYTQTDANTYGLDICGGFLVSTYPLSIVRSNPNDGGYLSGLGTYPAMVSVCNDKAYCRGGSDDATLDQWLTTEKLGYPMSQFTQLRKPITAVNRSTARTYTGRDGASLLDFEHYKQIAFLWAVENQKIDSVYVDRSTGAYLDVTAPGGGFYGSTPRVPIGLLDEYGNQSVVVSSSISHDPDSQYLSFEVFNEATPNNLNSTNIHNLITHMWITKFRGIENLFGDSYTCVDNALIRINSSSWLEMTFWCGLKTTTSNPDGAGNDYLYYTIYDHNDIDYQGFTDFLPLATAATSIIPNHDHTTTATRIPSWKYELLTRNSKNTVLMGGCMTTSAIDPTLFSIKCDVPISNAPSTTNYTSTYRSMRLVSNKPTLS